MAKLSSEAEISITAIIEVVNDVKAAMAAINLEDAQVTIPVDLAHHVRAAIKIALAAGAAAADHHTTAKAAAKSVHSDKISADQLAALVAAAVAVNNDSIISNSPVHRRKLTLNRIKLAW